MCKRKTQKCSREGDTPPRPPPPRGLRPLVCPTSFLWPHTFSDPSRPMLLDTILESGERKLSNLSVSSLFFSHVCSYKIMLQVSKLAHGFSIKCWNFVSFKGGFAPWPPDQGLCPWTPLRALPQTPLQTRATALVMNGPPPKVNSWIRHWAWRHAKFIWRAVSKCCTKCHSNKVIWIPMSLFIRGMNFLPARKSQYLHVIHGFSVHVHSKYYIEKFSIL